ncbi:MAG TPA: glutamate--tRNA ligase, partial [Cytophagales bacterium]|nr:glutamate--tRNA ligase [Cytophagales bacterium]
DKAVKIGNLLKERVVFDKELAQEALFFFEAPKSFAPEVVQSKWNAEAAILAQELLDNIPLIHSFAAGEVKQLAHRIIEEKGYKLGKVMPAVRLILTGATSGPDLMEIMEVLGKEEVLWRLKSGLEKLGV